MINQQQYTPHLTIGGRPDDGEFAGLKKQGASTIVSFLTPDEAEYAGEEAAARAAGLEFVSIPVTPDTLSTEKVESFCRAVEQAPGAVVAHCKGGGRASVMAILALAKAHHWSLEQTLQEGEKRGAKVGPDSPYRNFVESYFATQRS
jgi:uncharacterized protein (TIGR01244 family)